LYDFVKVLDFGLVKPTSGDHANVTSQHVLLGTPLYVSPEAVNQADTVDARADVYAVAAVGYFLLTGTPVFNGKTVMEICLKHLKETPEPPSARIGRPINVHMEALILRCLAKAPADRPANAGKLLRELDAVILTESWTATEASAWWQNAGS